MSESHRVAGKFLTSATIPDRHFPSSGSGDPLSKNMLLAGVYEVESSAPDHVLVTATDANTSVVVKLTEGSAIIDALSDEAFDAKGRRNAMLNHLSHAGEDPAKNKQAHARKSKAQTTLDLAKREIWLGGRDSNPDNLLQRQVSYR